MELNGLANPESTTFTGIHNVEPTNNHNQVRPQKPRVNVSVADIRATSSAYVGRRKEINEAKKPPTQTTPTPAKLVVN